MPREISEEEGRAFALEYNAAFYETSSKTGSMYLPYLTQSAIIVSLRNLPHQSLLRKRQ